MTDQVWHTLWRGAPQLSAIWGGTKPPSVMAQRRLSYQKGMLNYVQFKRMRIAQWESVSSIKDSLMKPMKSWKNPYYCIGPSKTSRTQQWFTWNWEYVANIRGIHARQ